MDIGSQIKKYRIEAKMSQKELGEKLGVSQQQIAQYESGKRVPKIETINNIAAALNVGIKRLYPEYREEWIKTETYRIAKQNHAIRENILGIFSTLGTVTTLHKQIESSSYNLYYNIELKDKSYTITIEQLNKLAEYCAINLSFLLDLVCTSATEQDNTKAPTD